MARHEADREDLLREATALRDRGELSVNGWSETVVAGRRTDGRWSIYFGGDPCYHFDASGRLRRAYVDGLLYRTEGTTLAALKRERTDTETQLQRHDLDNARLTSFLDAMQARLSDLQTKLDKESVVLIGQRPEDGDFLGILRAWLAEQLSDRPRLAPAIK